MFYWRDQFIKMEYKWQSDRFDEVNYDQTWNTTIEMLLLREDLWCVTCKTSLRSTTPTHQSTWDSKDQKTRATILLSMKDIQRVHVKI
jgi:hypothetical protein